MITDLSNHQLIQRFSGSAIAVTIIAIAAMTTITLGLASLVPRDYRQAQALGNAISAEHAAVAGIERALLQLANNPYFEQSKELSDNRGRPHGGLISTECLSNHTSCKAGVDRFLGLPTNQTGVMYTNATAHLGLSVDTGYTTSVWHMAKRVGNPNDIDDGFLDRSRTSPNINPILERDQTRILDVTHLDNPSIGNNSVKITWAPIIHSATDLGFSGECNASGATFLLHYAWLDSNNNIYNLGGEIPVSARGLLEFSAIDTPQILSNPNSSVALRLQLRFLATSNGNDESRISDCFIRYSLEPIDNNGGVDLGVSVIESTGYYANTRRKLRVLVDRQNGEIIDIFDFGVACQICEIGE